ncbi:hypothetical protein Tco_0397975 [Tanacetum coccineum]
MLYYSLTKIDVFCAPKFFTTIEESKDLTSLSLDETISDNLKVYEVIIKKDSEMIKGKREQSSRFSFEGYKMESSDEESSTSDSKYEEYAMAVRDFKKFFKIRGSSSFFVKRPHHYQEDAFKHFIDPFAAIP